MNRSFWLPMASSIFVCFLAILGDRMNDTQAAETTKIQAENIERDRRIEEKASKAELDQAIAKHEEKEKEIYGPIRTDLADIKNFLFYKKMPNR